MRYIILHRTNAHWEAGAIPGPDLIARVGALLGRMAKAGVLESAEGLGPSAEGARIEFASGSRSVVRGPFHGSKALESGFTIIRARSLDDAIEFATRQHDARDDAEVDIRPVHEPWDIGVAERPAEVSTRRYMILRKSSADHRPSNDAVSPSGVDLATETMPPGRRGRRYKNSQQGIRVYDGPFSESKELIGGYVIISAASLEETDGWARAYIETVGAEEVDVRELA